MVPVIIFCMDKSNGALRNSVLSSNKWGNQVAIFMLQSVYTNIRIIKVTDDFIIIVRISFHLRNESHFFLRFIEV